MENQTYSDFFIGRVKVGFIYAAASKCWLEGKAHRPPRRKRSLAEKLTALEQVIHTSCFIPFVRV